jgi:TolB protein
MNADGSGPIRLTTNEVFVGWPFWSADGTKIIFYRTAEIFLMNADGSNQVNLTNNPASDNHPKWQRISQASAAALQFSASNYSVDEGAGVATVNSNAHW